MTQEVAHDPSILRWEPPVAQGGRGGTSPDDRGDAKFHPTMGVSRKRDAVFAFSVFERRLFVWGKESPNS